MTVVGTTSNLNDGTKAFIWTQENGMKGLNLLSSSFNRNLKISKNGLKIIGNKLSSDGEENNYECFIWDRQNGVNELSNLTEDKFLCMDISLDGSVIVGYKFIADGRREAVIWRNKIGIETLGKPTNNNNFETNSFESKAMSVSADGTTIAGFMRDKNSQKAFIWNKENGMQDIGDLGGGDDFSLARDISADGTTVVGKGVNINNHGEAFVWDRENGMRRIGDLKGGSFNSYAEGVSKDGSIVVGRGSSGTGRAFIWNQESGIQDLKSVLIEDYHLDLKDWILISAHSISDDGKTIVGWGYNPSNDFEAWIAKLND